MKQKLKRPQKPSPKAAAWAIRQRMDKEIQDIGLVLQQSVDDKTAMYRRPEHLPHQVGRQVQRLMELARDYNDLCDVAAELPKEEQDAMLEKYNIALPGLLSCVFVSMQNDVEYFVSQYPPLHNFRDLVKEAKANYGQGDDAQSESEPSDSKDIHISMSYTTPFTDQLTDSMRQILDETFQRYGQIALEEALRKIQEMENGSDAAPETDGKENAQ